MNPTKQRQVIAEACGKKWLRDDCPEDQHEPYPVNVIAGTKIYRCRKCDCYQCDGSKWERPQFDCETPDYLNDLNAMHEAEATLSVIDHEKFAQRLWGGMPVRESISATAARRAEIFIKTIGKWKEDK